MFPETEILKRGNSIFLIFDSRIYSISNAEETNKDHIYFSGLRFPLVSGRTLQEEESAYYRRNATQILGEAKTIEEQLDKKGGTDDLVREAEITLDINFFINHVARADNPHIKTTAYQPIELEFTVDGQLSLGNLSVFPKILEGNYLVANSRLYPLSPTENLSTVLVDGKNYTLDKSNLTIQELEKKFQERLTEELRLRVISRSKKCKELQITTENKRAENEHLVRQLGIRKTPFAYESGKEGFDFSIRRLYALIEGHYNHTTGKTYQRGYSAATFELVRGEIPSNLDARFAERVTPDSPFVVSSSSHCLGDLHIYGKDIEEKMLYLREVANTIATQGGFYQQSTSSSDDSSQ